MRTLRLAIFAACAWAGTAAEAATPQENMNAILASASKHLKVKVEPVIAEYCNRPEWCEAYLGRIQVQVYGRGVIEALTSSQISAADYQKVCAVIFAGLAGGGMERAETAVATAFSTAAKRGSYKRDIADVEIEVRADMSGESLQCQFFKY